MTIWYILVLCNLVRFSGFGITYQENFGNPGKVFWQNIPINHKIYQSAIKYTKWLEH
jgi:hypothetical protein